MAVSGRKTKFHSVIALFVIQLLFRYGMITVRSVAGKNMYIARRVFNCFITIFNN